MKALILGLAVTVVAPATAAQAEPQRMLCGNRDTIHERLAQKYDEAPVIRALSGTGNLVEMLASPDGTWTMIVTRPGGPSCVVSTGDMWQPVQTISSVKPQA